jgi:hypothetical protein
VETNPHYIELLPIPEANAPEAKQIYSEYLNATVTSSHTHSLDREVIEQLYPEGEEMAHKKLKDFIETKLMIYDKIRDNPQENNISLTPYLTNGILSFRQCVVAARTANNNKIIVGNDGVKAFIKEIVWKVRGDHCTRHFRADSGLVSVLQVTKFLSCDCCSCRSSIVMFSFSSQRSAWTALSSPIQRTFVGVMTIASSRCGARAKLDTRLLMLVCISIQVHTVLFDPSAARTDPRIPLPSRYAATPGYWIHAQQSASIHCMLFNQGRTDQLEEGRKVLHEQPY